MNSLRQAEQAHGEEHTYRLDIYRGAGHQLPRLAPIMEGKAQTLDALVKGVPHDVGGFLRHELVKIALPVTGQTS